MCALFSIEEGYLNPKGLILLRLYREVLEYTPLNNLKNLPPPLLASQAINPLLPETQFYSVRSDRNSQLLRVKLLRLLIKTIVPPSTLSGYYGNRV